MTTLFPEVMPAGLSDLATQEHIIESRLGSFVEIGAALERIRDDELYRQGGFDGFVEYLKSKPWGFDQRRAYYLIDAQRVCTMVQTTNERQARELVPLVKKAAPQVVRDLYAEAIEEGGGTTTAKALREKVQAVLPKKPKRKPAKAGHARSEELREVINLLKQAEKMWNTTTPEAISQAAPGKQLQDAYTFLSAFCITCESMKTALDSMRSHVD